AEPDDRMEWGEKRTRRDPRRLRLRVEVRRRAPAFDADLAQRSAREELLEARTWVADRHAEVVGQVRQGSHAMCARCLEKKLTLRFRALDGARVVLGRDDALREVVAPGEVGLTSRDRERASAEVRLENCAADAAEPGMLGRSRCGGKATQLVRAQRSARAHRVENFRYIRRVLAQELVETPRARAVLVAPVSQERPSCGGDDRRFVRPMFRELAAAI